MSETIKDILMRRDGMSEEEAEELIEEAKEEIAECVHMFDPECAEQVLADYFGLESDYLIELL